MLFMNEEIRSQIPVGYENVIVGFLNKPFLYYILTATLLKMLNGSVETRFEAVLQHKN